MRRGDTRHTRDNHPAPLDANFRERRGRSRTRRATTASSPLSRGRILAQPSERASGAYSFLAVRPHRDAAGHADVLQRSADAAGPDPAIHSDQDAQERLVSRPDLVLTEPEWALGYRFDIVLRGWRAPPFRGGREMSFISERFADCGSSILQSLRSLPRIPFGAVWRARAPRGERVAMAGRAVVDLA